MLTSDLNLLDRLEPIKDSMLVAVSDDSVKKLQVTHDEEDFLVWVVFSDVFKQNARCPISIKFVVVNGVCIVRYCELSFFQLNIAVDFSLVNFLKH